LRADTPIGQALKVLADGNILSAPVVTNKDFLGFIDVMDIAGYLLTMKREEDKRWYDSNSFDFASHFMNTLVSDVVNFSQWNYPVYVSMTSSLNEILQAFDSPGRHFKPHRVVVLNEKSEPYNILSQSDLIRFFATRIDSFPVADKTITELGLPHACVMVQLDFPVSDALWTLYNHRVSGVAVINPEGRLAGNLSASDLRGIRPEGFDMMNGSVIQFLAKGTDSHPKSAVCCLPDTTFLQVLSLFSIERVHRIYVVNEANVIRGVISLSDVLSLMTFYQSGSV